MEKQFNKLTKKEIMNTNGGILGIDDAIFWSLFVNGFAAGIYVGINKKNREEKRKKRCYKII